MVRISSRQVEDLGAEHHQIEELALALEESFAIDISDEVVNQLYSVRDVIMCVALHRRRSGTVVC